MSLLVLCDHDRGTLDEASLEALTFGRDLAGKAEITCEAVVIGAGADAALDSLAAHGAEQVHLAGHDLLTDYGPEAWGETLTQLVRSTGATAVMACGTDRGNEVLAHVAARLDEPFVANCTDITPGDVWTMTRVQWGGSLLEDTTLDAGIRVVSVTHHAVEATPADRPAEGSVVLFTPDLGAEAARTVVRDRVVLTQGITLATSPVVVGGGRGVGSEDGFAQLEDLAGALGGVVGCSRAVTNNGWRPHSDQVGQTGTRIAPDIYIAAGISGAIQHWVGAMAAKNILAVNTDGEANMVAKAGYAVIGDLHKVIPAITEEIARRRG
ncbi:MAG: electron transfer flavoprotein subunit alpha/FixB family protein [Acidimicrobiales bacterium]|jgi:electron transfer flavoprotein alpha subunit|nr:electron transfer flavoprotein subunit alpha [Actinomycetota bacterium]MDP6062257.1 electron transfer flavoprotein subunit alpha/FixB family protein [Acidimicrobiales bacterium]MDP6213322.1 electron transfer flavoprotein subunit alpha/FixB family protein [Acidimicrobiales bacterium]MDP7209043.1 electron transfer flavoprotein subunit alpha/FixB family protein [Acidimicrobiales bacterium]HJO98309.1 electron transfer flavoprotein subunit alpha/FixB family protein [Acidimicrobiales bacterium]|tara:strand:+ start:18015 stop:18986 length:972 start_codon:yes stop_codon:yes gene_type:complete